jgi:hypothetical protein
MGELAMITDGYAQILPQQPHYCEDSERRPMEAEERRDGPEVKQRNHGEEYPVELVQFALHQFELPRDTKFLRFCTEVLHGEPALERRQKSRDFAASCKVELTLAPTGTTCRWVEPGWGNAISWRRYRGIARVNRYSCEVDGCRPATPQLARTTQSGGVSPSQHSGSFDRQRLCKDAQNMVFHCIDFRPRRKQKRCCAVLTSVQ